jgi:hypothetical protein
MVFWLAVLVAAFFAWVAVQIGFYATWTMFISLLLAAYLAIFLSPVVIDNVPAATGTPYGYTLVFLCVAAATIILSYGICYAFLSGRLRFEFPKILDTVGAGILGFLAGFLASSLVAFSVSLTPFCESDAFRDLTLSSGRSAEVEGTASRGNVASAGPRNATISYLCFWCGLLHTLVSSTDLTTEDALSDLQDEFDRGSHNVSPSSGTEASRPGATGVPPSGSFTAPNTGASGPPASGTYNLPGTATTPTPSGTP